jgi:hypothetical protein
MDIFVEPLLSCKNAWGSPFPASLSAAAANPPDSDRLAGLLFQGRQTINCHVRTAIRTLEQLLWPKHLKNVPEYVGGHHERMDGKGYPRGLTREQMSWQARMMGIADIFEARSLTTKGVISP